MPDHTIPKSTAPALKVTITLPRTAAEDTLMAVRYLKEGRVDITYPGRIKVDVHESRSRRKFILSNYYDHPVHGFKKLINKWVKIGKEA